MLVGQINLLAAYNHWQQRRRDMPAFLFSTPGIAVYTTCVTLIFGLVMGSFLNCLAWRSVRGESWVHGRSHCDSCGHVLAVRDLVPVVSWLASRGRCRYCGARISLRNPLSEITCAVIYLLIVMRYDFSLETLEMLGFASTLFVATLTDLDDYVIPNGCIVAAVIIRLLFIGGQWLLFNIDPVPFLKMSLIGAAAVVIPLTVIVIIMDHVLRRPSMGGGDLKLFGVAGLYFGWQSCLFLLIVACVLGIVFALVSQRKPAKAQAKGGIGSEEVIGFEPDGAAGVGNNVKSAAAHAEELVGDSSTGVPEHAFPFGPSIALACIITMLVGDQVLVWYLSLLI
jgi:prepilin signal peptidase PulO-like enzyme (type II secretory pathway)